MAFYCKWAIHFVLIQSGPSYPVIFVFVLNSILGWWHMHLKNVCLLQKWSISTQRGRYTQIKGSLKDTVIAITSWRYLCGSFELTGVNSINILHSAFTCVGPKSAKDTDDFFLGGDLGSPRVKAAHKTVVKLTPGSCPIKINRKVFSFHKFHNVFW